MFRELAKRIPLVRRARRARQARYLRAIEERARSSPGEVFGYIYERNVWNSRESASGAGSELGRTEALRREFPALLERLGTETLLDVPCGDLNWISQLDLSHVSYIGGEIVPDLVAENERRYGASSGGDKRFVVLDLTSDPLPAADTVLSRDCLVHLSNELVTRALENIRHTEGVRWMLLTHFPDVGENHEITTGRWRPTNLCAPPFHLPEPDILLDEEFSEYEEFPKYIGVWRVR